MVASRKSGGPRAPRGDVLDGRDAARLLLACSDYLCTAGRRHVGGRHRTEVVAEAMERAGLFDLASEAMEIHEAMRAFGGGDFEALKAFVTVGETSTIGGFLEDAKGTRFAGAAAGIVADLKAVDAIIGGRGGEIDWTRSAEVVATVKRERFPQDLTMAERLTRWQAGRDGDKER